MLNEEDKEKLNKVMFKVLKNKTFSSEFKVHKIAFMLDLDADENAVDEIGCPLLHRALLLKENEVAGLLLERKAKPELCDRQGRRAVMAAVWAKNIEGVKMLMERNVRLEGKNKKGRNALMLACINGDVEMVKLLVEKGGVDVDVLSDIELKTALMFAVENKKYEVMTYLIENGAHIDYDDKKDKTALMIAVENKDLEGAKILVKGGADVNLKYDERDTVLHKAVSNEDYEMAEFLLNMGAKIDVQNLWGYTPLMLAYMNGDEWLAAELETRWANKKLKNCKDEDLLFMAINGKNTNLIKKAIKSGCDVNRLCLYDNFSPLMVAGYTGNLEVVKTVVEAGAKLETKVGEKGESVFEVLINTPKNMGYDEVVKYLISKGCKVRNDLSVIAKKNGYSNEVIKMIEEAQNMNKNGSFWDKIKNVKRSMCD